MPDAAVEVVAVSAAQYARGDRGEEPFGVGFSGVVLGPLAVDRSLPPVLDIEEDVLTEARERAGRRELSSYMTDALRRQLQRDRLGELLAEMEAESGPISEDLMEEAQQPWRGPAAAPKPRSS